MSRKRLSGGALVALLLSLLWWPAAHAHRQPETVTTVEHTIVSGEEVTQFTHRLHAHDVIALLGRSSSSQPDLSDEAVRAALGTYFERSMVLTEGGLRTIGVEVEGNHVFVYQVALGHVRVAESGVLRELSSEWRHLVNRTDTGRTVASTTFSADQRQAPRPSAEPCYGGPLIEGTIMTKIACLLAGCATAILTAPAFAQEARLGIAKHDITNTESGADIQAQLIFGAPPAKPRKIGFRPYLVAGTNTDGHLNYGGGGFQIETALTKHWFVEWQNGIVIHDGRTELPPPDQSEERRRVADNEVIYGCGVQFHLSPAIGRRINESVAVSAYWEHLSHGQILCDDDKNEGLDNYGLRVHWRF